MYSKKMRNFYISYIEGCSSLEEIQFTNKINWVDKNAFAECKLINSIDCTMLEFPRENLHGYDSSFSGVSGSGIVWFNKALKDDTTHQQQVKDFFDWMRNSRGLPQGWSYDWR